MKAPIKECRIAAVDVMLRQRTIEKLFLFIWNPPRYATPEDSILPVNYALSLSAKRHKKATHPITKGTGIDHLLWIMED
jgi:hypothetical protein